MSQQVTENEGVRKRRSIVYIDGFNLYFALKAKNWKSFMWLDLVKFSRGLVRSDQELVAVKYFTSRIKNNQDKQKRQNAYLDALGTLEGLEIFYGDYQDNSLFCRCGRNVKDSQEKQTDVNIATQMVVDAITNKVDDIILITADSDQCPAIRITREAGKNVLIVLPPGRGHYVEVKLAATNHIELTAKKFKNCLLPETLALKSGFTVTKPEKYR
jgi:uncharacterized LabA/DUF88 family protein